MAYYVLNDNKCLFEGMTKEQIIAAITQAVETHEIHDVDTGFVTTLKEGNKNNALSFWVGTTAEYNAIDPKVENCFYILTDDTELEDLEAAIRNVSNVLKGEVIVDASSSPMDFTGDGTQLDIPLTSEHDIWDFTLVQVVTENNDCVVCNVAPIRNSSTQPPVGATIAGVSTKLVAFNMDGTDPKILQLNIAILISDGYVRFNESTQFPINDPSGTLTAAGIKIKKIVGVI